MGNGNAVADAGGAKPFALQDDVEYIPLGNPGDTGCLCCQFLKELLLGIDLECGNNRILVQQICQCHFFFLHAIETNRETREASPGSSRLQLLIIAASIQPIFPSWRR